MNAWEWGRVIGILGPIVAMLVLGFVLALRSGVAQTGPSAGLKRAVENASRAVILVGGCLIGLAVIHQLVGQRVGVIW